MSARRAPLHGGRERRPDRWVVPTLALLGTAEGDAALAAYVASLHPPGRGSRSRTSSGSRPAARTSITRRSAFRCAMRLACWTRSTCTRTAWTGSRGSGRRAARLARRGREEHGEIRGGGAGRAHLQGHGGGFRVRAVRRARRETRPGGGGLGNPRRARAVRVAVVHVATRDSRRATRDARRATPSRVGAWKGSRARDREEPYRRRREAAAAKRAPRRVERRVLLQVTPTRNVTRSEPTPARPRRRGRPCSCRWTHIRRACGPPRRRLDERVHDPRRRLDGVGAFLFVSSRTHSASAAAAAAAAAASGNAYPLPFSLELLRELLLCRLRRRPEHPDPPGDSAAGAGGASP